MLTRRELLLAGASVAALCGRARAAGRDRPLLVSVLTCPRPRGVSYLEATTDAVDADLADRARLLVCDGPEPPRHDSWTAALVPPREKRPGQLPDNKRPGWVAIWTAFSMGADLLFLEDDIRPLRAGVFTEMARHQVPAGAAFTSFYHRNRAPGLYDAASFNMSQAVLLPLESVRYLWAQRDNPGLAEVIGVDLAIAVLGRDARWRFEQTPNLVAHVGRFSAALPGHYWSIY